MSSYINISNHDNWKLIEEYSINNNSNDNTIDLTNNVKTTALRKVVYHKVKSEWTQWFEIKQSTIKNAGLGLFALRSFKEDDFIGKYDGTILNTNPINQQTRNYTLKIGETYINGRNGKLGYVHKANDARNSKRNQCYITQGGYVKVYHDKKIRKNTEIFISYGEKYWTNRQ